MSDQKIIQTIRAYAEKDVPDLKTRIKEDPRFMQTKRPSIFERILQRPVPVFSAFSFALILIFLFITNIPQEIQASSSLYMEINPSIQIDLDEEDKVLTILALNTDGEALILDLNNLKGEDVLTAIDEIIGTAIAKGYLDSERPVVLFDVLSDNEERRDAVTARIESRIPDIAAQRLPNLDMVRGNAQSRPDEVPNDIEPGMMMRRNLINQVLDLYPDEYTYDQLSELSVVELRRIIRGDGPPSNPGENGPPSNIPPR